jgi:hypothetical protein
VERGAIKANRTTRVDLGKTIKALTVRAQWTGGHGHSCETANKPMKLKVTFGTGRPEGRHGPDVYLDGSTNLRAALH